MPDRPAESAGKTPKSQRTRAAILQAAQELFAAQGYERTTVRDVAARAAIDPAMVMRYFGSKEGLFAAASAFALQIPDLRNTPREEVGETLVEHFFVRWESGDDSLQILLRTSASNEVAAARMQEIVREQIAKMVIQVRGRGGSQAVAALIATQMLGLAYCRYVLRLPALLAMSRESIVRSIGATVQRYLA